MEKDKAEILNPKTDWVFKLMFSKDEEGNKALISFLNAFLKETYGTNITEHVIWLRFL